jgi:Flp pilus assembly protein TadG
MNRVSRTTNRKTQEIARNEQGQALAEFAMVLPVLMLVILGIIQFAIAFNNYEALTDAVRAGARQAAVSRSSGDPVGSATARVRSAAGGSLDASACPKLCVTVTYSTTPPTQGGDVTVRATYPYEINLLGLVVKSGTLTSETTERVE